MESDQKQVEEVLSWLEERLRHGEFQTVDFWLNHADPSELNSTSILVVLTITFWGKDKLLKRNNFLVLSESILKTRLGEERAENLLKHRR